MSDKSVLQECPARASQLLVYGQTAWRNYVRDVAVPLGFARAWWEKSLRGALPLGRAKDAGVSLVSGMICGVKSVPQECPARASHKSAPQECPTRVSHKSVLQECPTPQECAIRVSQIECPARDPQQCPTRVSHKSVQQECPTRVSHKSVPQECPIRVSHKSVLQECPVRVSHRRIL